MVITPIGIKMPYSSDHQKEFETSVARFLKWKELSKILFFPSLIPRKIAENYPSISYDSPDMPCPLS